MEHKIKAVIFDMDGVLVNTPYVACEVSNKLLQNEGIQFSQGEFKRYLHLGIEDRVALWNTEFHKKISPGDFFTKFVDLQVQTLADDMKKSDRPEILRRLKSRNLKLGLATKARQRKVEKILAGLGIETVFDSVITGDVTKKHKPHPEVYLNSLRDLDVEKKDAIIIEDSPHGISAAKAAGVLVVGYKTDVYSKDDLQEADVILYELEDIIELLDRLGKAA